MRDVKSDPFIPTRPWTGAHPPKRVLAIRLQAMGDVVISLPYLQRLREQLPPGTRLDFLVRAESAALPRNLHLFDHVYVIGGGRRFKLQLLLSILLLPRLLAARYDLVLDVQNSPISRLVRRVLRPRAWSEFDKRSTRPAGERTRLTIEAAGMPFNPPSPAFSWKSLLGTEALLPFPENAGPLVVLNPGGAFASRHWPEEYYVRFARLWAAEYPGTRFLLLGIARMAPAAARLEKKIGAFGPGLAASVVNLVEKTTPAQAFILVGKAQFVLSEDSGLMHMAWVSGVPTLALFGGSRSDWARPLGARTAFLDGAGLDCAPCLQETCQWGDVRCLRRHTPEEVLEVALSLVRP
ncbi:glycosyltransferase family 9 protein [Dinghuibacter silviterrae]|uniref:ADP-heptose:LPS heptosyltransferase n=1 Tax=Dinghuibacter silviterrae TaxID=1539049 RepID=A0A4R8DG64_9BACT|nr:glycosyltransferase family 9 protein [Dinghuibacter silviterrae]TDW96621.1 ADP-heptose:LPS heptosyltransferase [Dinghuibacter silviterrae]